MSYQTTNTIVAAALVTLGRKVIKLGRYDGGVQWSMDCGDVDGKDVGLVFYKKGYVGEPVASMVKVANAREWLLDNVVHGFYEVAAEPDSFITENLDTASCLVADGYFVRAYRARKFYFAPEAQAFVAAFKQLPCGDTALDWQRRFLVQITALTRKAKYELWHS
jgi:hypothetical protein